MRPNNGRDGSSSSVWFFIIVAWLSGWQNTGVVHCQHLMMVCAVSASQH